MKARCVTRSRRCAKSGSAICVWGNPRPSYRAVRRSASSLRPSFNARNARAPSTSSTNRRPAYTPPTSNACFLQLERLVASGATVIVVEHDLQVIASSDWVIDIGPGAGDEGGKIVAVGSPADVARSAASRTADYLSRFLAESAARAVGGRR